MTWVRKPSILEGPMIPLASLLRKQWNLHFRTGMPPLNRLTAAFCRNLGRSKMDRGDPFKFSPLIGGNPGPVFTRNRLIIPWIVLSFLSPQSPGLSIDELELLPDHSWHLKLSEHWDVSEDAAHKLITRTADVITRSYATARNIPSVDGTSRLSPYLAWGLVSPRQICQAVLTADNDCGHRGENKYLVEIGWREFSYQLLYHFPHIPDQPLREKYSTFPWLDDNQSLRAWQFGNTGYPMVDAGMRQLYETGWMHNRVRMVVASFLVKHLLISWQEGARWFWDTLVDADLASNTQGWQWAAGCGADAAPYFRIFNPITQGEKFDGKGEYARKWIPSLKELPGKWVFKPWEAPPDLLLVSDVFLGTNYPHPCVDHKEGRARALAALASIKES